MTQTYDDPDEFPCPACGAVQNFQAWATDGCGPWFETECDDCGVMLDIEAEYSVTLYATVKEETCNT
jgi:Zn ribbon nucleic-acid-binding protein